MNTYYEQLLNIKGADELKTVVKKWEILSQNINQHPFDTPIILPDLFLYTHSGYGNTKLLALISEYIDSKKNLMAFYGDSKFIEFKLEYCNSNSDFKEIHRFMDVVSTAAGFRNEFKGIIRVNVNDWVGHHKEKHFLDFLQLLKINTANWLIVLTISNVAENDDTRAMESVVSMYLRIETVTLNMPSDQELIEYADTFLSKYGFTLDESAKAILLESVKVLRNNKYFNGLHTITDLCNDIIYSQFSTSTTINHVITADMLADFSADSEYIKRTVIKIKKAVTLGF